MENKPVKKIEVKRSIIVMTVMVAALLILFAVSRYISLQSNEDAEPGLNVSLISEEDKTDAEKLEENIENVLNYNFGADAMASYIISKSRKDLSVSVNVNDNKTVFGYYLDLTLKEINTFLDENEFEISKLSMAGRNQSKDEILISWDSDDLSVGTLYDFSGDEPVYKFDISAKEVMEYCDYSPEE